MIIYHANCCNEKKNVKEFVIILGPKKSRKDSIAGCSHNGTHVYVVEHIVKYSSSRQQGQWRTTYHPIFKVMRKIAHKTQFSLVSQYRLQYITFSFHVFLILVKLTTQWMPMMQPTY